MSLNTIVNTWNSTQAGLLNDFLSPGQGIDPDLVFNDIMLAVSHRPVMPSATSYRPWDDDFVTGDTFQLAVGTPGGVPSNGAFLLGVQRSATKTVISTSMANPTNINCTAHGCSTGDYVHFLTSTLSTPDLVGNYYPIIKVDDDNFTVPVNVTSPGTGGTFNSFNTSGLTALPYNISAAALQTALSTVTTAEGYGSAQVALTSVGGYEVSLTTPGAFPLIYGNGGGLLPQSTVTISQIVPGSGTTEAIQILELQTQPVAYCEPATPFPAASVNESIAQAGSGTQNKVYEIDFTPGTYDGSFSITMTTIASDTSTTVISANAATFNLTQLTQQLNAAAGITQGDIAVSGSTSNSLLITFQGTQGVSNAPVLSVANISLQAPQGVSGFMSLNTVNLYLAFSQTTADELPFTLSIRRTRLSGEQSEYFLAAINLKRNLITGTVLVPLQLASYYTEAQVDAFLAAKSNVNQSIQWAYVAGGTPSIGQFAADNDAPASATQLKFSRASIAAGMSTAANESLILQTIVKGSILEMRDASGFVYSFLVNGTPTYGANIGTVPIQSIIYPGANFTGIFTLTSVVALGAVNGASQLVKLDTSGHIPTGIHSQWQIFNTDFTAQIGVKYQVDTSGGAVTMTLPIGMIAGDPVEAQDATQSWATNSLTIAVAASGFGTKINGSTSPFVDSVVGDKLSIVAIDGTTGVRIS